MTYTSIPDYKVKKIKKLYNEGLSIGGIAKTVGVTKITVYKYIDYKSVVSKDSDEYRKNLDLPYHLRKRIENEENGKHSRFVWPCGCITIMDGDSFTIHPCSNECPVIARAKQVAAYYDIKSVKIAAKYEAPKFEKQTGMTFPKDIIERFNGDSRFCLQCSGCHGCR